MSEVHHIVWIVFGKRHSSAVHNKIVRYKCDWVGPTFAQNIVVLVDSLNIHDVDFVETYRYVSDFLLVRVVVNFKVVSDSGSLKSDAIFDSNFHCVLVDVRNLEQGIIITDVVTD